MSSSVLSSGSRRQIVGITAGAAVLLLALRLLPNGPRLTHMDFVVGGPGALEFCDALNPRFLPVVTRSSPVTVTLDSPAPLMPGAAGEITLTLETVSGKPIGPGDLLPTATQKINLLGVDPGLRDFQAFPAAPGSRPGKWSFPFTPQRAGTYRIFADFTPVATGQEMYASADLTVGPGPAPPAAPVPGVTSWTAEAGGCRFVLRPPRQPIRAREPFELKFTAEDLDGSPAALEPFDGALASLVAFDQNRTGFVNLHASAAAGSPSSLIFNVSIPDPGRYVIWSRVRVGGREITAPFRFEVLP